MISLNSRDHENQLVTSFTSESLASLLVAHNIDDQTLFPPVGQIAPDWQADPLIHRLEMLYELVTPREKMLPGNLVQMPERNLTDEDKAVMKTQSVRYFPQNDESYVEFTAPVIVAAAAAPDGYTDLATLLTFLKEARNGSLQLETVSL